MAGGRHHTTCVVQHRRIRAQHGRGGGEGGGFLRPQSTWRPLSSFARWHNPSLSYWVAGGRHYTIWVVQHCRIRAQHGGEAVGMLCDRSTALAEQALEASLFLRAPSPQVLRCWTSRRPLRTVPKRTLTRLLPPPTAGG